jgi:hypothetical protein
MGEYDHFVGELWPGAFGWLPLDPNGTPNGPATLEPPPPPALACHVTHDAGSVGVANADLLVTSSGAPVTDHMNSNSDNRQALDQQFKSAPKPPHWDDSR